MPLVGMQAQFLAVKQHVRRSIDGHAGLEVAIFIHSPEQVGGKITRRGWAADGLRRHSQGRECRRIRHTEIQLSLLDVANVLAVHRGPCTEQQEQVECRLHANLTKTSAMVGSVSSIVMARLMSPFCAVWPSCRMVIFPWQI